MKYILGIDCSTRKTNVGIAIEEKPIGEINLDLGREQSAFLPVITRQLMDFFDINLNMIDRIAVTVGPGYFTGIRVGISYATALGEGLGVPVIPICSLEAVVYGSCLDSHMVNVPLMWGSRNTIYAGAYTVENGRMVSLLPVDAYSIPMLEEFLKDLEKTPILISPDSERCRELFKNNIFPVRYCPISGSSLASMAFQKINLSVEPTEIKARYYREPDIGKPKASLL